MEKYTPIQLTLVSFTCCMQSLQSLISMRVFFTSCTQHLKVTTFRQVKSYLGILRLDRKIAHSLLKFQWISIASIRHWFWLLLGNKPPNRHDRNSGYSAMTQTEQLANFDYFHKEFAVDQLQERSYNIFIEFWAHRNENPWQNNADGYLMLSK